MQIARPSFGVATSREPTMAGSIAAHPVDLSIEGGGNTDVSSYSMLVVQVSLIVAEKSIITKETRMRKLWISVATMVALILMVVPASAQNVASQKAYFGAGTTDILNPTGAKILHGYIKTSGVGDLLIGVSTECALWTATQNKASKGGDMTTSTSRAAVNITVYVNGVEATPGQVVFCDRLQQVNLQFQSLDTINIDQDAILLEIFLKTKNANHFNFYAANPGSGVHYVEVYADSIIETDGSTLVIENTRAVVGKRTLVIEEYNNP